MELKKIAKRANNLIFSFENLVAVIALSLIVILPSIEIVTRLFNSFDLKFSVSGVKGSSLYIQNLVIWVTFVGALITTRENRHISLSVGYDLLAPKKKLIISTTIDIIIVAVTTALSYSSFRFVSMAFEPGAKIGAINTKLLLSVIPVSFMGFALHTIFKKDNSLKKIVIVSLGVLIPILFSKMVDPDAFEGFAGILLWPSIITLLISMTLGAPIFIVLGGVAAVLFFNSQGETTVIANEAYGMLSGPVIPTIPLFTLAGFILSESKAGERLVNFFQALFGWMPGGLAIMATFVCAFFTTFTGASGVTILALGGLLSYVLIESRYPKKFTTGLLTSSGSIGLLFPPSLPIILYGVVAHVSIKKMFIGGLIPGFLMVLTLATIGIFYAFKHDVKRVKFSFTKLKKSFKDSFLEILLPVIILLSFFGGITTLVETGALAVVYTIISQVFIHKDLSIKKLYGVLLKVLPITGGVLIILAVAKGLSYYIVDAEIPMILTEWTREHIHSKFTFLILLNIALLLTGCFMDIFSAIIVVVPLIIPLGEAFGIHPVHLGIIFLANLELGYLTPPVGLNLFLAAFRFEEPLVNIYKSVIPFLIALLVAVILITYIPWLTTVLL